VQGGVVQGGVVNDEGHLVLVVLDAGELQRDGLPGVGRDAVGVLLAAGGVVEVGTAQARADQPTVSGASGRVKVSAPTGNTDDSLTAVTELSSVSSREGM
jgi:hypothetical protein